MKSQSRKILFSFFKVTFTILIVGILLTVVGWRTVLDALSKTALIWLLPMYGVMINGRILDAVQMKLILGKVGYRVRVERIFLANALSCFYTFILPGDMLAGLAKWANLSAATGDRPTVLNAMVYNKLALLIPALIIGTLALAWENPFHESVLPEALVLMALLALTFLICIFHPDYGEVTDKIIYKITKPLPGVIRSRIEKLLDSMVAFRSFRLRDHFKFYLIAILLLLIRLIVFALASRAVGIQVNILTMTWVMALLISSQQLPITLANIGVREGILMAVLSPYGVPVENAFAFGLIIFSNQIIVGLIGLSYQIALTLGFAQWTLDKKLS